MGWFDEQIKQRILADDDAFQDAFASMASVVMGHGIEAALMDDRQKTKDAINEILKFYHIKSIEVPQELTDINEQLEYLLRPSGIMRRVVNLEGEWYKDAVGAFLATHKDGGVVALIPNGAFGYSYFDHNSGNKVKLNRQTAKLLETEAICFYKPLPLKKLSIADLMTYVLQSLSVADYVMVSIATLVVTLVGLLMPILNRIIFSDVIGGDNINIFVAVTVMMVSVSVSSLFICVTKNIIMERIRIKTDVSVQAAAMMRVLSLPALFFKQYSSGELSTRLQSVNSLCSMLCSAVLETGLTSVFSLIYITQIFAFTPALVVPAIGITIATLVFTIISTLVQMKISRKSMELEAKESGLTYSFISGVQKLKLSGAEKRAFSQWATIYKKRAKLEYDPPLIIKIGSIISTAIMLIGNIVIYFSAVKSGISVADYFAFNVSYGMVSGAFMSLTGIVMTVANIKPVLEMVRPIFETVPEVSTGKKVLTSITGGIELNNVSFRYAESMPLIVDNLSLKIKPGQYVAIVGKTGCGKSTLLRLLLGFEVPQKGAIYFDGKDITTVDLKSLRRCIGTVLQNGKLFSGDIYSNITISAPWLTVDEAWKAAEISGIAQEIRDMPMGMHTMISEGSGGVSGGQRQRLMIARAVAPSPRILMFDEATSALDNITQRDVAESLSKLKCTRIVIAHRLSTIKDCDRIVVLDGGRIIEDGNYDELIENNGYFAELVARQRLDDTEFIGNTTLF